MKNLATSSTTSLDFYFISRPRCEHGECVRPGECQCSGGFGGRSCSVSCPPGRWGPSCAFTCPCHNGAGCDPVSGSCSCQPGWRGQSCDQHCPRHTFGQDCQEICKCQNGEENLELLHARYLILRVLLSVSQLVSQHFTKFNKNYNL